MTKELDGEFEAFSNRPLGRCPYVIVDAHYLKVQHNGTVIDQAVLLAYGVNEFGRREILGASVSLSEAEVHWRQFFESLQKRGLAGNSLLKMLGLNSIDFIRKFYLDSVIGNGLVIKLQSKGLQLHEGRSYESNLRF